MIRWTDRKSPSLADRHRASRVARRLGRRNRDWGGPRTSRRVPLDLEPSVPNPGSVRAHRSFSPRAHRARAGHPRSRITTGGPDARGGRAALGAAAQAARPSARRKLLPDPEPGLLGGRGSKAPAATPQVPPWILKRVAGPSMANSTRPQRRVRRGSLQRPCLIFRGAARASRRSATGSRCLGAFEERGGRSNRQRPRFGFAR